MNASQLLALDVEHARFNALKTLSTVLPSQFEDERFGDLHATRDVARTDGYYNRVLGLTRESIAGLDDALGWITNQSATAPEIRVELVEDSSCEQALHDRGFGQVDQLLWLQATGHGEQHSDRARQLSPEDWPALRLLLAHHGPISDATWQRQREHLCTDTFRWHGIFDAGLLVSAASMWVHDDAAILGSALTLPGYRKRGHHLALLRARRAQPPHRQFVDVEPESTSHKNCLRAGFEPIERRTIWVKGQ